LVHVTLLHVFGESPAFVQAQVLPWVAPRREGVFTGSYKFPGLLYDGPMWRWGSLVLMGCFSTPPRPGGVSGDGGNGDGPRGPCTWFGPWGSPIEITEVNRSTHSEEYPSISADKLHLVFESDVSGTNKPYESTRNSAEEPWGAPTLISVNDFGETPLLSADALDLYFAVYDSSTDIEVVHRSTPQGTFDVTGQRKVAPFATAGLEEQGITFSGDQLVAVFIAEISGGPNDKELFITSRSTATQMFDVPMPMTTLANPGFDWSPALSPDGLTLLWESSRSPYGTWEATRATRADPFTPIGRFNALSEDTMLDAHFSPDGTTLVFSWDDKGSYDIYMIERDCQD
jgi:hypothetical protein